MKLSKNSGDFVLCAIYVEHCNATLEATDVWLTTSNPAAFVSCIRNELQALRAHLDLEDTVITGGMAVLLPKLRCRQVKRWQSCPALLSSLTPLPTCGVANQTYIQSKLYSILAVRFQAY